MLKFINPKTIAQPGGNYTMAVEVPVGAREVWISGQVGADLDGKPVDGIEAQTERAWLNLFACLDAVGMTKDDVVRINVYLTRAEDIPAFRRARDRLLPPTKPASTLVVVAALAHPAWLVEIEAVAAKAGPKNKPSRLTAKPRASKSGRAKRKSR